MRNATDWECHDAHAHDQLARPRRRCRAQARASPGSRPCTGSPTGLIPPPPVADLVGFDPIYVTPGYVVFAYEPREEHYNTIGAVHGGILTTVLDTVMGCAVHSTLEPDVAPVTIELKTSFVRPVTLASGALRAEGSVVHPGSRVATAEAKLEGATGRSSRTPPRPG